MEDLKRAAELGISATNHSYGAPGGWEFGPRGSCQENWSWLGRDGESSDVRFGVYDETARDFDKVVFQSQTLSVFVAAGNERGPTSSPEQFRNDPRPWANFTGAHCVFSSGEWKRSLSVRKSDLWKNGFDTITGRGLAKNVITIGAAVRLDPPFDNSAIVPTAFSSMGPADDGRIKPDLLANGDELYSTFLPKRCSNEYCYTKDLTSAELALYATLPGTSMATPIATGISALLNQQSLEGKRGRILFADEMKAALIHTARSPTDDGRPSYRWGWGLIDAFRASELVDGRIGSLTRRAISDGATDVSLAWDDQRSPLAITATWIDDPGHPIQPPTLDDRTPSLINRLDVRLVSPGGKIYFPWSLNPEKPEQIATNNTANLVDNVQRIDVGIDDWEAGTWRLKIKSSRTQTVHLALAMSNSVKLKE